VRFNEFILHAQRLVEARGRRFRRAADDWPMQVVVDFGEGDEVVAVDIPDRMTADYDARTILGLALAGTARVTRPTKVALVHSSWYLAIDPNDPTTQQTSPEFVMPSDHPRRVEAVFINVLDAEIDATTFARIHRIGRRPPRLGSWVMMPREASADGHLINPLREAMR
jgi:hypothetical protein